MLAKWIEALEGVGRETTGKTHADVAALCLYWKILCLNIK